MRSVVVSPRARRDLIGIWQYTLQTWGAPQADRYLDDLDHSIRQLAEDPAGGRSREELREGYHSIRAGRHVVFYMFDEAAVRVMRVLHDQMDVDLHF